MKVNASGRQDVVGLTLLWMFSETCKRDGGFVSLNVYTIWKGRLDSWGSYAEGRKWLSRVAGRLVGVEEPDAEGSEGLEESLGYSNMTLVIFTGKKGTTALKDGTQH
jgi:hypothetical protein